MPSANETKSVKASVSIWAAAPGRKLGSSNQAILIQKPKAVPSIKVDDHNFKLNDIRIRIFYDEEGVLNIRDRSHTVKIDPRGNMAATQALREFKDSVEEALNDYCHRKGVSGGGFQPVNMLGSKAGMSARGNGGQAGRVSLAPMPAKRSQPVTRQPMGLPSRAALPNELPTDDSPPDAHRSEAARSASPYFRGSKASTGSIFSPFVDPTLTQVQRSAPLRSGLPPPEDDPIISSPYTPPRRSPNQALAAPSSPDPATFGALTSTQTTEKRGGLPVQSFRRPFTSNPTTFTTAKPHIFQSASGIKTTTKITSTSSPVGALEGFPNLGNTCYLNAVLQAMLALPAFTTDLLSSLWVQPLLPDLQKAAALEDGKECADKVVGSDGMSTPAAKALPRVYVSLLRIILLSQRKDHGIIDPSAFRKAMARYYGEYGSRNQQDAHEFLGDVINTLQEELCPLARTLAASHLHAGDDLKSEARAASGKGLALSQGGVNTPLHPQGSLTEAEASMLTQMLPVSRNFHIEVIKTLTCGRCAYSRSRTEAFTDFSLDVVEENKMADEEGKTGMGAEATAGAVKPPMLNIPELLRGFFKPQVLELECEKCKHDKVHVTFCVDKLPNVLIIHLKRFRLDGTLNHKLTTRVQAPTSINMEEFCGPFTQNPAKQGALPKPVVEKDCSFLVAEQTPAPPVNTSHPVSRATGSATTQDAGSSTKDSSEEPVLKRGAGVASPTAPNKLVKVHENRERKQLNEALRRSQDDDRWDEDDVDLLVVPSPSSVPRPKRRLTTGEDSGSKRACHPTTTALSSATSTASEAISVSGTGSSVDTAIMLECDEEAVFDLTNEDDKEDKEAEDPELQDAIQRSLMDQVMQSSDRSDSGACVPPEALQYIPPPPPTTSTASCMDKENVCPNANAPTNTDASHTSAAKAPPAKGGLSASPFNLSLLTPAPSSREKRGPRNEPLQCTFKLKCVIRHIGKYAFSGHYITDVRTQEGSERPGAQQPRVAWKRYDDSVVSKLSSDDKVLNEDKCLETGYIYMYCLSANSNYTATAAALGERAQ